MMITPRRSWLNLFTLTYCLAVFLSQIGSAARVEPVFPGPDASPEELIQYYNEVQQYLKSINRPRFGKRSSSEKLGEDLYINSDS